MKINEIIKAFEDAGSGEAKSEAYFTLEHLFSTTPAAILANRDREYDGRAVLEVIEKRKNKIPLQHIFGKWSFMGEEFYVSNKCLIPRQDTEILVYEAIKNIKKGGRIADLCTGSGCIAISLLNNRPDITEALLVDISPDALSMARKNTELHAMTDKCTLMEADVTEDILDGVYDAILSNPPYIPTRDIDSLSDEVKKEPMLALDGGDDGLCIVRSIVNNSSAHLKKGGILMIEFGFDQGEAMTSLLNDAIDKGLYSSFKLLYDYGGNVRACLINK